MFCRFGMEGDNLTIRKINTTEILSLLLCSSLKAKHVTLDPTPEILGGRLLELLTLDGERFGRSFADPGSEPVAQPPYT
jgi:hypothetical protein